jgi:putative PIN family toxin of toxin-antitoxin system
LGKKSPVNKLPRVVLDTNCLISALLFSNGKLSWLRDAWQSGRFTPLASRDTVEELIRVFAYPKFKLNKDEQEILLADFLPYVETVQITGIPSGLPALRDPDDVIFLELAVTAKADALISGDKDIHAVKHQLDGIPILTVAEFAEWLSD